MRLLGGRRSNLPLFFLLDLKIVFIPVLGFFFRIVVKEMRGELCQRA